MEIVFVVAISLFLFAGLFSLLKRFSSSNHRPRDAANTATPVELQLNTDGHMKTRNYGSIDCTTSTFFRSLASDFCLCPGAVLVFPPLVSSIAFTSEGFPFNRLFAFRADCFSVVLKDYKRNREKGIAADLPTRSFPSAGFEELAISSSDRLEFSYPGRDGRYSWNLTLNHDKVINDFYWTIDYTRGWPDNQYRYWFIVHHTDGTKIEGFSVERDYDKGYPENGFFSATWWYNIRYTECGDIKAWMEEKDQKYLARLKRETKSIGCSFIPDEPCRVDTRVWCINKTELLVDALRDYVKRRGNNRYDNSQSFLLPFGGFYELDIHESRSSPKGWPDENGRYWWSISCKNGIIVEDFYWIKDEQRGFPDSKGRYWFVVGGNYHGVEVRIDGFSEEQSDDKSNYIQYTESDLIREWMLKREAITISPELVKKIEIGKEKVEAAKKMEEANKEKAEAAKKMQEANKEKAEAARKLEEANSKMKGADEKMEEANKKAEAIKELRDANTCFVLGNNFLETNRPFAIELFRQSAELDNFSAVEKLEAIAKQGDCIAWRALERLQTLPHASGKEAQKFIDTCGEEGVFIKTPQCMNKEANSCARGDYANIAYALISVLGLLGVIVLLIWVYKSQKQEEIIDEKTEKTRKLLKLIESGAIISDEIIQDTIEEENIDVFNAILEREDEKSVDMTAWSFIGLNREAMDFDDEKLKERGLVLSIGDLIERCEYYLNAFQGELTQDDFRKNRRDIERLNWGVNRFLNQWKKQQLLPEENTEVEREVLQSLTERYRRNEGYSEESQKLIKQIEDNIEKGKELICEEWLTRTLKEYDIVKIIDAKIEDALWCYWKKEKDTPLNQYITEYARREFPIQRVLLKAQYVSTDFLKDWMTAMEIRLFKVLSKLHHDEHSQSKEEYVSLFSSEGLILNYFNELIREKYHGIPPVNTDVIYREAIQKTLFAWKDNAIKKRYKPDATRLNTLGMQVLETMQIPDEFEEGIERSLIAHLLNDLFANAQSLAKPFHSALTKEVQSIVTMFLSSLSIKNEDESCVAIYQYIEERAVKTVLRSLLEQWKQNNAENESVDIENLMPEWKSLFSKLESTLSQERDSDNPKPHDNLLLTPIEDYDFVDKEVYSGLVTDLELAVFSATVYLDINEHDSIDEEKLKGNQRLRWWQALKRSGWAIFRHTNGEKAFQAIAYRHEERKQLVVAFRCTVPNKPVTLWIDWEEVCKNTVGSYGRQAYGFFKETEEALKQNQRVVQWDSVILTDNDFREDSYHITFTGHSLGAWVASIASSIFGYPGIVFDNPGAKKIVEKYREGHIQAGLIDDKKFAILNYQAMPHLINTAYEQIGRVLQLETKAEKRLQVGLSHDVINYSLSQHSIDLIVETFAPETGMPYLTRVKEAEKWPFGGAEIAQELKKLLPPEALNIGHAFCHWWFSPLSNLDIKSRGMKLIETLVNVSSLVNKIMRKKPEEIVLNLMQVIYKGYNIAARHDALKIKAEALESYNEEFDRCYKHHYRVVDFNPKDMKSIFIPGAVINFLDEINRRKKSGMTLPKNCNTLLNVLQLARDKDSNIRGIQSREEGITAVDLRRRLIKELPTLLASLKDIRSLAAVWNDDVINRLHLKIRHQEIELDQEIGRGAFGVVYLGRWNYETVAVKQLHLATMSENALTSFKREISVMAQLRSNYIVLLKGICLTPYKLVMEYMKGGSLYKLLQSQQGMPCVIRQSIMLDIAKGLDFLHSREPLILHRDLKSQNVLLDRDNRAKLADFGLSKVRLESSITQTYEQNSNKNKSVGTLPWMAPECFGITPKYSEKSDIYAYGMVLWEIVSRKTPYEGVPEPNEIRKAVKKGKHQNIPDETNNPNEVVSRSVKEVIKFCWFKEAEKRPTAKEAIMMLEQKSDASFDNQPRKGGGLLSSTNNSVALKEENIALQLALWLSKIEFDNLNQKGKQHLFGLQPYEVTDQSGNCLFASIAAFVPNAAEDEIRRCAVDYIRTDIQLNECIIEGCGHEHLLTKKGSIAYQTLDHYLELMRMPQTWGTQMELLALARKLERPIAILTPHNQYDHIIEEEAYKSNEPIFLNYVSQSHYEPLAVPENKNAIDILNAIRTAIKERNNEREHDIQQSSSSSNMVL